MFTNMLFVTSNKILA